MSCWFDFEVAVRRGHLPELGEDEGMNDARAGRLGRRRWRRTDLASVGGNGCYWRLGH